MDAMKGIEQATETFFNEVKEMGLKLEERSSEMMTIKEFAQEMKTQVEFRGYTARIEEIQKNNGVKLDAIIIETEGTNIFPTIYLQEIFEEYENGKTIEACVDRVLETHDAYKLEYRFDVESLKDFEKVKDKIIYNLIGTERNQELLQDIPNIPYLDMSIVFKIYLDTNTDALDTVLIHNSHMKLWGVTESTLMELAVKNTPEIMNLNIFSMASMVQAVIGEEVQDTGMTIVSNKNETNGAASIMYPGVLLDIKERLGDNFYVLPSSIHEIICQPYDDLISPMELKVLVMEINRTQVKEKEILTDSVYQFKEGSLVQVA